MLALGSREGRRPRTLPGQCAFYMCKEGTLRKDDHGEPTTSFSREVVPGRACIKRALCSLFPTFSEERCLGDISGCSYSQVTTRSNQSLWQSVPLKSSCPNPATPIPHIQCRGGSGQCQEGLRGLILHPGAPRFLMTFIGFKLAGSMGIGTEYWVIQTSLEPLFLHPVTQKVWKTG